MKKIAILYICTGKYNQFFSGFYKSAEIFLLKGFEKTYFVWTDDDTIGSGKTNVNIFYKECAGFPADSLFRFEMFLHIEEELKSYDYIYFMNSNAQFIKYVGEEILPDETGLAMGIHPGKRLTQHPMFYPYERNRKSLAYVAPYGNNYHYFMGGLNGGISSTYIAMIKQLCSNIREDFNNGIIAIFHDESHINAYMRQHKCKILPTYLNMAEEIATPDARMIFREKTHIDPYFNKDRKFTKTAKAKKAVETVLSILRWYLKI